MKKKILYVDDELDNLTAFKAVFRRRYDIDTAASAKEAIALAVDNEYQIIISDQRMPYMTGVEMFEQMRLVQPDAVRMVLTGYSDMNAIIDAINKGNVYYYISKPWKAEELQVIIDKGIETYELRKNNRSLEQENVVAQFKILRNQINPHFLFNSMNILGSLIHLDPPKAVQFTRQFSKIYRKVLELKDESVISVAEELEFVSAYLDLQGLRFEEALTVDIQISEESKAKVMPPFALQTVIENAIKHNVISEDRPLNISLTSSPDFIEVKNNLQLRKTMPESTGTGLSNLTARYKLIGGNLPLFNGSGAHYIARLPIID